MRPAFAFLLMLLLSACVPSPKAAATVVVAATDVQADAFAEGWAAGTNKQIEHCRAELGDGASADERRACLGRFAPDETDKAIAALKLLVAAQLAVKEAAECEEFRSCPETVDWTALGKAVQDAWAALKPYVQALKETNP